MEGKYKVTVLTPMGIKPGMVELHIEHDVLSGIFYMKGFSCDFNNGEICDNEFEFLGKHVINKGIYVYSIKGRVDDGRLTAIVDTSIGRNITIKGTKE
ncbi:MAG: hypothetical protein E6929_14850 [Clostridium sp.]|nr:hypothetical protein [Clostridium sp.]